MTFSLSRIREYAVLVFAFLARLSFAIVLFLSPLAYRTTLVERRIGNVYSSYTDFFIYPADYFIAACLFFGVIAVLFAGRGIRRGPWYLTYPLCLIIVLSWGGVFSGIDAQLTVYHSLRLTLLLGLYFVLVNVPMSPHWVGLALAAGVMVQGSVAFGQFQQQHSLGLYDWGELILDPMQTGPSIVRDGTLRVLRVYGLTDHPNLLGGFFTFALILILGYYFAAAHTRARYLLLVPIAIGSTALVFTFSRAAWLGLAAGVLFLGFCLWKARSERARHLVPATVVAVVLAAAVLMPAYANRNLIAQRTGQEESFVQNSGEARSLDERDALIESSTRIFVKHAIMGVGNGALPLAMYWLDPQFDQRYFYQPAHVVLLEVATELGIVGGILWLWLIVAPWLALYANRRALFASPWLAAVGGALLAFTAIGFLDYYPWLLPLGRIMQWTIFGLLAQLLSPAVASRQDGKKRAPVQE